MSRIAPGVGADPLGRLSQFPERLLPGESAGPRRAGWKSQEMPLFSSCQS